jgi:hypothetical protein
MILNSNKTFFLSTIKEKIINFICDKFNIADYPNLHDFIDVKQLDIVNVYDEDILYKIKIRLKRHGEVTINNLEEHREVIETVVERPIKFEIVDYKNVYVNVLYLDKEKEENIETNNIVRYKYFPAESFDKDTTDKTIRYEFVEGEKEGLSFYIGKDLEGTDFKLNILDGSLLIGGMTGSGKGNIINVLVTSLMLTYTENELVFLGCDVTKSDVYYFGRYKHFRGMASTCNEFLEQAEWLENKLYKERDNAHAADSEDKFFRWVYRKIMNCRKFVGIDGLTMKNLQTAGMTHYLKQGIQRTGLGLKEFLLTEEGEKLMTKYNYFSEHRVDNIIARYKQFV